LCQIIAIILSLSITSIKPNNFELQFNSSSWKLTNLLLSRYLWW
jgi:hypothetical protein